MNCVKETGSLFNPPVPRMVLGMVHYFNQAENYEALEEKRNYGPISARKRA